LFPFGFFHCCFGIAGGTSQCRTTLSPGLMLAFH
jgi:hypothetical protein